MYEYVKPTKPNWCVYMSECDQGVCIYSTTSPPIIFQVNKIHSDMVDSVASKGSILNQYELEW